MERIFPVASRGAELSGTHLEERATALGGRGPESQSAKGELIVL
jgi:hypothetical protein